MVKKKKKYPAAMALGRKRMAKLTPAGRRRLGKLGARARWGKRK